jgi:hypothetical protein
MQGLFLHRMACDSSLTPILSYWDWVKPHFKVWSALLITGPEVIDSISRQVVLLVLNFGGYGGFKLPTLGLCKRLCSTNCPRCILGDQTWPRLHCA